MAAAAVIDGSLPPPHIVYIVADDLGTFDVPFTGSGSEVVTPTLSALAADGLVLDSYYVQPLCTPSRSSFMTGRHPVQLGLQHGVIRDGVPDAVPINETMLPALLKESGFKTYFIGKWHLGFHQPRYTPERRGFDGTFGYYTGNAEYWSAPSLRLFECAPRPCSPI
jgi:arylsulfatase B